MESALQRHYLPQVIELRKRGYSMNRISEELSISKSAVHRWITKFAPEYQYILLSNMSRKSKEQPKIVSQDDEVQALQAEIKRLQKQLEMAEIRAEVYDKMIDIAEATFNIPIRKKSGTKQ
ncbi:MAG: helix-turn-helix domain-containing protein [Alistipes sp.]|nr:helix-turn-helix domain-containing protein [Alistipes sp.]